MIPFPISGVEASLASTPILPVFGVQVISDFSTSSPFLLLSLYRNDKKMALLIDDMPQHCANIFGKCKLDAEVMKSGRLMITVRIHNMPKVIPSISKFKEKIEYLSRPTKTIICFAEIQDASDKNLRQ